MSLLTSLRIFLYLDQITSLGFLSKRFFNESLSRNLLINDELIHGDLLHLSLLFLTGACMFVMLL